MSSNDSSKKIPRFFSHEHSHAHPHGEQGVESRENLTKFAWISIAAAVATISLKVTAFLLTGSVGLLSDAMESLVNLAAACIALLSLYLLSKPADSRYPFGRSKVEYFSSAIEGAMILMAAAAIAFTAIVRIVHPAPLEKLGVGVAVSLIATAINASVGIILLRAGKRHRSATLKADGVHLLTDVATSVGVVVAVALVSITHWTLLDPLIALVVAFNIVFAGFKLVREALAGLMDVALPEEENARIVKILQENSSSEVQFHGLQTRRSGRDSYANVDMLVPGRWSVQHGHDEAERVIGELCESIEGLRVFIHVEPIEDPISYEDIPDGFIPLDTEETARPDKPTEPDKPIEPDEDEEKPRLH